MGGGGLTLASLMFAKEPRMWTCWSATTILVRVAFSMAKRVFPSCPAMRPIARERWSGVVGGWVGGWVGGKEEEMGEIGWMGGWVGGWLTSV